MGKVSDSKAVVEYDDGRLALVWIPDYETSCKVGSRHWSISSHHDEYFWDECAKGFNKCYMIVDRALLETDARHLVTFHIGPDGDVSDCYDQFENTIDAYIDKDFRHALKVTGARPYNRDDVILADDDSLEENYIYLHRDSSLLSKRVLAADNPALELGKQFWSLLNCAEANLLSCRRLILKVARKCAEKGTVAVINKSFFDSLSTGINGAIYSEIPDILGAPIVAMMPSVAVAKKHCAEEVFESVHNLWEKNKVLESAIQFGNKDLIADLLIYSREIPSALDVVEVKAEKLLALGAKTTRLLLDSGFQPTLDCSSSSSRGSARAWLFPSSQAEKEASEAYSSDHKIKYSPDFSDSICSALQAEYDEMGKNQSIGKNWHGPVLDHLPWVLENLKRVLGKKSEPYAQHISSMLALVAGEESVETGAARYSQQINMLLDEVDRLKKESSKEVLAALGRWLGDTKTGHIADGFDIKFAQQSLSEEGRVALRRLAETLRDFGADVSLPGIEG